MVYKTSAGGGGLVPPEAVAGDGHEVMATTMPVTDPKPPSNFEGPLPGPSGGSGGNAASTADGAPLGVPSHLDSFFAGSKWSRDDVLVLAAVIQTAILLYWLFAEVRS